MRIALLSLARPVAAGPADDPPIEIRVHARALATLGHEVRVFVASGTPGLVAERVDGCDVVRFGRDDGLVRRLLADTGRLDRLGERLAQASDVLRAVRLTLESGAFDVVEIVTDGPDAALATLCNGPPMVARILPSTDVPEGRDERFVAARLTRLGLRGARAISVPSLWLRNDLRAKRCLDRPAFVIPDGVEPPGENATPATEPSENVVVGCIGVPRGDLDAFAGCLATSLEGLPDLRLLVLADAGDQATTTALSERLGASALEDRCAIVTCEDELTLRAALARCDASLFWPDHAAVPRHALLAAIAAGKPVLARDVDSMTEVIRTEIDGLLFSDANGASRGLRRITRHAGVRQRLGKGGARRAVQRFDPVELAQRRLQVYALASARRLHLRELHAPEPAVALDAANWFEAWWLAGTPPVPTTLARDADGTPALARLPLPELRVAERVLVRSFCDGPADWTSTEWHELRELGERALDRAEALRARGDADPEPAVATHLALPPVDHPMFEPDQPGLLLAESWHLGDSASFTAWLTESVAQRDFTVRALDNVHLRRIAVEAAKRAPSAKTFDVLRLIYRHKQRRDRVVADDLEFLARGGGTEAFRSAIDELGLHAPFPDERFPAARGKRSAPANGAAPRITIVIPSFRHEAFVGAAIESCLRQSIDDVRVLVADDKSPDGTVAAARAIEDPRLEVSVNDRNLGLGGSVRAALGRVETPFVALLNSDDLFHPERLERCLAVLESDPDAALVATGFSMIDRDGLVLRHENASAVDVGPQARGWLRWFEEATRDYHSPADWCSFENLLQHNVLATSSNMVFRTDWVVEHFAAASGLKYCVDWYLFLRAAMEQRLRMVPEPLLAYRLHNANTVWFRDGGRADYVVEVNHVVDVVLHEWLLRGTQREGANAAVARLARLLEEDVARHGETDGLALALAALARQAAGGEVDSENAAVAALAEAALRRKSLSKATAGLDVDPWSLRWRSRMADRYPLEHEVAQGFVERARSLEGELQRLRLEIETRRREVEDAHALADQAAVERAGLRERLTAETGARERAEETARHRRADLETKARDLATLRAERDRIESERARLDAVTGAQRERIEALEAGAVELRGRLDDAEQRRRALEVERDRLVEAVARATAERDAAREEAARVGRVRDRAIDAALAGDPLTPAADAGSAASAHATERVRHVRWHAMRVADRDGRARRRILVFGGEPPTGSRGWEPLLEVGRQDGLDAHLVLWEPSPDPTFAELLANTPHPPVLLADDSRLAAADRRYFERRIASGVEELGDLIGDDHRWFGRAIRAARAAKSLGAGVTVAHGFGLAALEAFATRALSGVPYALVLGDEDLPATRLAPDATRRVAAAAALVLVDTGETERALTELLGTPAQAVGRRWPLAALATASAPRGAPELAVVVPWSGWLRADPRGVVAMVRAALDAGIDLRADVVGTPQRVPDALRARLELGEVIATAGLHDRIAVHDAAPLAAQRAILARADLALFVGHEAPGCGIPAGVVAAAESGCAVVVSGIAAPTESATPWDAVPAGDRTALLDTLRRCGAGAAARETRPGRVPPDDEAERAFRDALRRLAGQAVTR